MEVRFENFRCFRDTGLVPIKPITLLVGENSSGKTSFLAGLQHAFHLIKGERSDLNTRPFELGSFMEVVHRASNGQKPTRIQYSLVTSSGSKAKWRFRDNMGDMQLQRSEVENSCGELLGFDDGELQVRLELSSEQVKSFKIAGFPVRKVANKSAYRISHPKNLRISKRRLATLLERSDHNIFTYVLPIELLFEGIFFGIDETKMRSETADESKLSASATGTSVGLNRRFELRHTFSRRLRKMIKEANNEISDLISFSPLRSEPERAYFFGHTDFGGTDPSGENVPAKIMKLSRSKAY